MTAPDAERVTISCRDGVVLSGHLWGAAPPWHGTVIINNATGVLASYYHYYARFLAAHGFAVLTYDYRGIGASRPAHLRGCGYRWRDWGDKDFDAALRFIRARAPDAPLYVVGHSVGGFLPGLAENASTIDRLLTVGAQHAYWRDYAHPRRMQLFVKWHVVMPLLTALCGYFPGRRLGWLEDLPAGVANEWSFGGSRMEANYPREERGDVLKRFAAVTAPLAAICVSDDELGTVAAVRRTLAYYPNAQVTEVGLTPADYGYDRIGHFGLFHARHESGFWRDTLTWLRDGVNPWPNRPFESKETAS